MAHYLLNVGQSALLDLVRSLKVRSRTQAQVVQSESHVRFSHLLILEVLLGLNEYVSLLVLPLLEFLRVHLVWVIVGKFEHFSFVFLEDGRETVVLTPLLYPVEHPRALLFERPVQAPLTQPRIVRLLLEQSLLCDPRREVNVVALYSFAAVARTLLLFLAPATG